MGSLAAAGAMSGLGQGLISEQHRQTDLTKMEFDQARETRIKALEHEWQTQRDTQLQGHEDARQDKGLAQQAAISENQIAKARDLQKEHETYEGGEKQKDRDSRENIAKIKEAASGNNKKTASRWEFKSTPSYEEILPNGGGIKRTPAQVVVNDKLGEFGTLHPFTKTENGPNGNKIYTDNYYKEGVDPQTSRRANPADVQSILDDPSGVPDFIEKYGYLPGRFVAKQKAVMTTQTGMRNTQSNSDTEEDTE